VPAVLVLYRRGFTEMLFEIRKTLFPPPQAAIGI
jgi:hypothetical protein